MTIHCPNTGAMTGCDQPGSEIWYSRSTNPNRKYAHSLEVVVTPSGRVGVNTHRANALIAEVLRSGILAEFVSGSEIRAEPPIPDEKGRFDFLLREGERNCFIEVKSLTLCGADGVGRFPDAPSTRAVKHVQALQRRVLAGERAVLVFCVQHTGVETVTSADEIHPEYGAALRQAIADGVEVFAYACRIERHEIEISQRLPVLF